MSTLRLAVHRSAGFTLLEILIAVAIFAVVSIMALGGYNQLLTQSDRVNANMERTRDVQLAVQRMVQDFAELEPRPVREALGSTAVPVLRAERGNSQIAELTRAGWSNPAGVPRPTLQRVAYQFEGGELRREYWLALDRTLSAQPVSVLLLDKVKDVQLRFLTPDRTWQQEWPPGGSSPTNTFVRPIAVEITLELEDFGKLLRLVEIPGMRALQRQQAGVALITAVLIVALATILAVSVGFKGYLGQRRTANTFAFDQAYQVGLGGEAWAADALRRDAMQATGNSQSDDFTDIWATPIPPIPIDGGEFEGSLEDMQGRFNLNNLVKLDPKDNGFAVDPKAVERLERLLEAVKIEKKWANLIADFIDADSNPQFPDGAEDPTYTGLTPPYRTPNMPITRTTELLAIAGFGAERFRRLEPFVAALPVGTTINLCTASPELLDSLSTRQRQYTLAVKSTRQQRKLGCFPSLMDYEAQLNPMEKTELIAGMVVGQTSSYFQSTIFVTIGTTQFTLYSLLYRQGDMIRPTLRSFGTI